MNTDSHSLRGAAIPLVLALILAVAAAGPAWGHPEFTGDPRHDDDHSHNVGDDTLRDPGALLSEHDEITASFENVISGGPSAKVTKNLAVAGRGERLVPGATTDVWAHGDYAYIGTFDDPCGTGEGAGTGPVSLVDDLEGPGIPIFNVENPNKPSYVGNVPSVEGSRINDVKVASMNGGDILVHSNESCAGGPGGFEIYNVDDPLNPVHLGHVRTDDINPVARNVFGAVDNGVHNLYLFTRGDRNFAAAQVEGFFGSFQVYDITDPANPQLESWFGAEYVEFPEVDWTTESDVGFVLDVILDYLFGGFGMSQNRFLHDHYVTDDGTLAWLANWDAGLLLVDISDPGAADLISVALDVENGSLDGEVNSHSVWPTADLKTVVEGEEDFDAIVSDQPLDNFTFGDQATNTIPGVGLSAVAGDDFEASQTGNAGKLTADSLSVESGPLAGNVYPVIEGAGNQPKLADTGPITGDLVWAGEACDAASLLNAGEFTEEGTEIAVVRRGTCFFFEKLATVAAAGADAIAIANNVRDDTPWSGLRIWDYSNPENPVLASTFYTECAADPFHETCDPRGTYSSHNVIVEGHKVYVSWYSEGVLVLDISDPYNPVEVARYHEAGAEFEERNGGIQNFWGVYKIPDEPWVYASDRNGGLYVLKEFGQGSGGKK